MPTIFKRTNVKTPNLVLLILLAIGTTVFSHRAESQVTLQLGVGLAGFTLVGGMGYQAGADHEPGLRS